MCSATRFSDVGRECLESDHIGILELTLFIRLISRVPWWRAEWWVRSSLSTKPIFLAAANSRHCHRGKQRAWPIFAILLSLSPVDPHPLSREALTFSSRSLGWAGQQLRSAFYLLETIRSGIAIGMLSCQAENTIVSIQKIRKRQAVFSHCLIIVESSVSEGARSCDLLQHVHCPVTTTRLDINLPM